jgi:hypothetical protein
VRKPWPPRGVAKGPGPSRRREVAGAGAQAGAHAVAEEYLGLPFLKRRYARAIEIGDDETASRLRIELDLLMNGPLARIEANGDGRPGVGKEAAIVAAGAGTGSGEDDRHLEADILRGARRNVCTPLLEDTDWFVLREC